MAHEVVFSPEALADLNSLYDHIASAASPERALVYVVKLQQYCLNFSIFPERGTRRDELRPGLRTIGYQRQATTAFHIAQDRLVIDRVLYGGRNMESA